MWCTAAAASDADDDDALNGIGLSSVRAVRGSVWSYTTGAPPQLIGELKLVRST